MKMPRPVRFALVALIFSTATRMSLAQGDLAPTGTPGPTFKTLQQVEPRTDLQKAPASAVDTSNAAFDFIINQPGSYYLSANLAVTKQNGIRITVEGVTLDLNGFEISRPSGMGDQGIEITATGNRAVVHSGSIRAFSRGIVANGVTGCEFRHLSVSGCGGGIAPGNHALVERCRLNGNAGNSISAGVGCSIIHCTVSANIGGTPIFAGNGSSVTDCTVTGNTVSGHGISVGIGCTVARCTVSGNTVDGNGVNTEDRAVVSECNVSGNTAVYGILVGENSVITDCTAANNTHTSSPVSAGISAGDGCVVTSCSASGNNSTVTPSPSTGMGFEIGENSTIQKCTARLNDGDGIRVSSNCLVSHNSSGTNGIGSNNAAGIHATGDDSRIEANNVANNDRGIDVDDAGNLIIKNSASGNGVNYDIVSGNVFGPIVDRTAISSLATPTPAPVTGNSAASTIGTTDPWANISY